MELHNDRTCAVYLRTVPIVLSGPIAPRLSRIIMTQIDSGITQSGQSHFSLVTGGQSFESFLAKNPNLRRSPVTTFIQIKFD